MKINILNKEVIIDEPKKIIDLFDNKNKKYLCALVDNKLKDLNYVISKDSNIELLDLSTYEGVKTYQTTLRYIVAMAVKKVYPKAKISFSYSVSRTIFASISGLGHALSFENLEKIKKEVKRIIDSDLPINYKKISMEEALEYYSKNGSFDKIESLKYRYSDYCHVNECEGYMDYLYTYLAPTTGYIKSYEFKLYSPGFLISYPRVETEGDIPSFSDERVFRDALRDANFWSNNVKCESIYQINGIIEQKRALEFINLCETRHNNQLTHLGDKIAKNIDDIKLICVAGPSSSGKTTFTNRLIIELKARGYSPLMISMDDYYRPNVDEYAKDKNGKIDFEKIECLDLELFDKTIFELISGNEVRLPIFNFKTRGRSFSEPKKLAKNQPIIIEGIHGLNSLIAPSIPDENKFKIYIAPIGQYRIDAHTPISISDVRLLRRIVRDSVTRGRTPIETIKSWESVRNGEFKWIYPNQNSADFIFNSDLSYELCVLKKYAIPLLEGIDDTSDCYCTARRLIKFLKYYLDISDKWVPCNSILREFIGNSVFYTEDTN